LIKNNDFDYKRQLRTNAVARGTVKLSILLENNSTSVATVLATNASSKLTNRREPKKTETKQAKEPSRVFLVKGILFLPNFFPARVEKPSPRVKATIPTQAAVLLKKVRSMRIEIRKSKGARTKDFSCG
jgi:hypothetical protein